VIDGGGAEKWSKVSQEEAIIMGREAKVGDAVKFQKQLAIEPPRMPNMFPIWRSAEH
jgi:hypothetical protein